MEVPKAFWLANRLRIHHRARAGRDLGEQLVSSTDLHMKQNKTKKTPKTRGPERLSESAQRPIAN